MPCCLFLIHAMHKLYCGHIGFNGDCAVNIINAGESLAVTDPDTGSIIVQWAEVGPGSGTDCAIRAEPGGSFGQFLLCKLQCSCVVNLIQCVQKYHNNKLWVSATNVLPVQKPIPSLYT